MTTTSRNGKPAFPIGPSLLDPPETNVPHAWTGAKHAPPRVDAPDQCFRHSGWARTRDLIRHAFHELNLSPSRIQRFEECGSNAWLLVDRNDPGRIRIQADFCHDRWCEPCARCRARQIAAGIARMTEKRTLRFITLTLRANKETLEVRLRTLNRSFATLRKTQIWRETQAGGVAITEVKFHGEKGNWHAHLHVLAEGKFIDIRKLSNEWKRITRDSFIVDVKLVRDTEGAVRYVTKYLTKPIGNDISRDPGALLEAIVALQGRRLAATWGTWRGTQLRIKPEEGDWIAIGTLNSYIDRAAHGDQECSKVLQVIGLLAVEIRHESFGGPSP